MKIIKVKSCDTCPFNGKCNAWKELTSIQRVTLAIGNNIPVDFILLKCELEDYTNKS